jgi:transposase-like protein
MFIVSKKAILGAEKLSDYFIKMAKKNKIEAVEQKEIIDIIKQSGKITAKDQFEALFTKDRNINRSKIANQLNVSRTTIKKWIAQINESGQ